MSKINHSVNKISRNSQTSRTTTFTEQVPVPKHNDVFDRILVLHIIFLLNPVRLYTFYVGFVKV